jgi:outer membrane protein OmpA-like peptidoglycan-associated protein
MDKPEVADLVDKAMAIQAMLDVYFNLGDADAEAEAKDQIQEIADKLRSAGYPVIFDQD